MKKSTKSVKLPLPRVPDGTALVDAVKTRHGWISFALTGKGLRATRMASSTKDTALRRLNEERRMSGLATEKAPERVAGPWRRVLKDAMEGGNVDLPCVPLDERGWSLFQRRVYLRARSIPRGKVMTYGDIARGASSPAAARAVGQLMARNPVAPIVPCHRVVASDGSLGGFSGPGGLTLKTKMLESEKK